MAAQEAHSAEAVRAVLDSVFAAPAYRWAEQPTPLRLLQDWWDRLGLWLEGLRADNPYAFRLLLLALLLALLLLLGHAAWIVWRMVRGAARPAPDEPRRTGRERRDAAWHARAADQAAAAGRFTEALQLAFVALALRLEGQGLLQYHPSKTPAECAREARLTEADRKRLGGLVRSLYSHAFGGSPPGPEEYRRWCDTGAEPWHAPAH